MHTFLNKRFLLFSLAVFVQLFHSCKHSQQRSTKITIESGQLPPDMATEKFILIGRLHGVKSYDKYLIKNFKKYPGEKVLATSSEIFEKYTDENGYRYILDYDTEYHTYIDMYGGYNKRMARCFYIYDQRTGEKYKRKNTSGFFALMIRSYLLSIDDVRIK